jgi:hypothetical protein
MPPAWTAGVRSASSLNSTRFTALWSASALQNQRQERHRRQVLRRTLWELDQMGVERIVLDSRRQPQDATDQAAVAAWRAQHVISSRLRVDHMRPRDEPILCVADLIAGAVLAARGDGDFQFLDSLGSCVEEIIIDLS